MEKSENIKAEITGTFAILSTLAVSGDAVDTMAAVRQKLRRALALLNENSEVKS